MNQEKIGTFIKEIRKKNKLTQQEFANQFGVTYQAVSKWENGKNVPDIEILKLMCEKYDKDINEFLTGKKNSKKKKYIFILIVIIIFLLILLIGILFKSNDNNFEFKTISTTCNEFKVTGSIAYNDNKSSIYISNINYCGNDDDTYYKTIECILYEVNNNVETRIDEYLYQEEDSIRLDDFFQNVTFHIENYSRTCKYYSEDSLYILINATDKNDKVTSYKIPLSVSDNCNK